MAVVKNLMVRAGADFSSMRKEMQRANKNLSDFKVGVSRTMKGIGVALAGFGIGRAINEAFKSAANVEASLMLIERQMGSSAQAFKDWSKNSAVAFNLAESDALRFGAVFSNLTTTFAKDTAQAAEFTTNLLKASSITASVTGRTMEDVMERMRSGLLGNTEAIEDLGISIFVNMIESTEAFKRFANGKSWNQLNFQTQQTIRYFAILEQVATKFGDEVYKNTNSRLQQLTAQLKNAQLALGQAFLPIYNIVIPALTQMAAALANVMNFIAQFSEALFGSGKVQQQTAAVTSQAGAVSGLGDAYEQAGKQAQKSVAGFDQVNLIGGTSGGVDATGGGILPTDTTDSGAGAKADGISQKIKTLAENVKLFLGSINFKPLIDSFNNLKIAIAPFTEMFFAGLKWFWDNVLVPFGTWTVESLIPSFLNLLSGALTLLNPILEAFKPLATFLWVNFLAPIAAWTGGIIVTVLKGIGTALTTIGNWMSEHQTTVTAITLSLTGFFAAWKLIELLAFIQTSGGVVAAFTKITTAIWAATGAKIANAAQAMILTAIYAKDFLMSIVALTVNLGRQAAAWLIVTANIVANRLAVLAIDAVIVSQFLVNWAKATAALVLNAAKWVASTTAMVANKVAMVASTVAQVALTIAVIAWNVAAGIGTAVTTAFGIAIAILTSPITLVVLAIAGLVAGIILLIKNWDKVKEAGGKAWEGIKNAWKGVANWFSQNVVNPVSNMFKGLINGVISGINALISGLNKINIDVPAWVGKIPGVPDGISSFGFNIPRIPKLATGGLVFGPTLATVGDNRNAATDPEVIAPLSKLEAMMDNNDNREVVSVLKAILSAVKANGNSDTATINKTALGKAASSALNDLTRRSGRNPLVT